MGNFYTNWMQLQMLFEHKKMERIEWKNNKKQIQAEIFIKQILLQTMIR